MDGNNYNSWADQWDDGPDPVMVGSNNKNSNDNTAKYKQKLGEGFGKTKAVASTGVKKLKDGTSVGLHWIKAKYSKATQKHWFLTSFCRLIDCKLHATFFLFPLSGVLIRLFLVECN